MRPSTSQSSGGYSERLPRSLELAPLDVTEEVAPTGGGPTGALLPLRMEAQEQSNWCWSAVGTSIGLFRSTGAWTQCEVATISIPQFPGGPLGPLDCCGSAGPCNVYGYLDISLATTQTFEDLVAGSISFDDLVAELEAGLPVCLRVAWNAGGAHFVAISGAATDQQGRRYIDVADPGSGSITTQMFDGPAAFPTTYFGGGVWTHTYFTK